MKISSGTAARAGLIVAAFVLGLSPTASNCADNASTATRPSADPLPIGSQCTVQVARGQAQEALTGTIQSMTDQWLVLTRITEAETMTGVPILNKVPYTSRLFRNAGAPARKVETWIPREAILHFTIEREPERKVAPESADVSRVSHPPVARPAAESTCGSEAGQSRDDNSLKMKFVWCPPGSVKMEQVENVPGEDEKSTAVNAFVTHGYWLGRSEVTQAEWKSVVETEPWKCQPASIEGDELAATWVSWHEAMAFCRKLTLQERKAGRIADDWEYTLPTEAQWERACRAQSETDFSFGDDSEKLGEYAWYLANASEIGDTHAQQIARKKPNAWGLHDMHGNVYEWCRDAWTEKLPGGRDPEVSSPEFERVCRGGCFMDRDGSQSRSSARAHAEATARNFVMGFRVALAPVKPMK